MLVLDCETDNALCSVGYTENPAFVRSAAEQQYEYAMALKQLHPTVVVTLDTHTEVITAYVPPSAEGGPPDSWALAGVTVERGFANLFLRLNSAPCLCGWNIKFDLGVLAGEAARAGHTGVLASWAAKAVDPMLVLATHTGKYLSLAEAANLNILHGEDRQSAEKSGSGLQAIRWYNEQKWTPLVEYCLQDVKLTAKLAQAPFLNVPVPMASKLLLAVNAKKTVSCQTPAYMA